jgi:hypothetical protein
VKPEGLLFEDFDKDAQLAERQEQFNGNVRCRCVVLNGVIIVGVPVALPVALKVGMAGDERPPNFMDSDKRGAEVRGVTRQFPDIHRTYVALREVRAARSDRAGRGYCDARRQRQEPQQHDASLDDATRNRSPQPKTTISYVTRCINGSASL